MSTSDLISLATAIATIFATLGTCWVAYLTIGIAQATRDAAQLTREQMSAALRPHIHIAVTTRPGANVFDLTVANGGQSSAMNLRLTLDAPFHFNGEQGADSNLQSRLPPLIESFPPGTKLVYLLGASWSVLQRPDLCPPRFTIRARYLHQGEEYVEDTALDLRAFLGSIVPSHPIADELEKLRSEVQTLRKVLDAGVQAMRREPARPLPPKPPLRHVLSRRRPPCQ